MRDSLGSRSRREVVATGKHVVEDLDVPRFRAITDSAHFADVIFGIAATRFSSSSVVGRSGGALGAIRTRRGDAVFRNLADDQMHWQINCTKASLATGVDPATVAGVALPSSGMRTLPSPLPASTTESEEAMDKETWMRVQEALQALTPPLYEGKEVEGRPGQDTNTSVRAFENRVNLTQRGVMGPFGDPTSGMWPATRELLFIVAFSAASP